MKEDTGNMTVHLSRDLADIIAGIADDASVNQTEVIRQALALMKVAHDNKRLGNHIGIVADPEKLDREIVGVL